MNANLSVASKADNEAHLYQVENKIKLLVGDVPNEKDKTIIVKHYTVVAKYRKTEKVLKYTDNSGNVTRANLTDFPTAFLCDWEYKDDNGVIQTPKVQVDFESTAKDFE